MMKSDICKNKAALSVAFVGIMAATLECGKLALSFLPNIEVVSLFLALYGYLFGWYGVAAALVFVCMEPLVWGVGSWVLTYAIYWPLLAFLFMILGKISIKNRYFITLVAAGMTLIFGVLSAFVDTAFMLGINAYFLKNLLLYYARGVVFYTVHLISNMVIFFLLFPYLSRKLREVNITSTFRIKKQKM